MRPRRLKIPTGNGPSILRGNTQLSASTRRNQILNSEIYDAAVERLLRKYPHADVPLADAALSLERFPRDAGESIMIFEGRDIRLLVTGRTARFPSLRILYEVDAPRVVRWHVSERQI